MGTLARGIGSVRERGLGATLRMIGNGLRTRLYVDEAHAWYSLDLRAADAGAALPDGLRLLRAAAADVPGYVALGQASAASTYARLAAGATLWLVCGDDAAVAFACWTFASATPVEAARGGHLPLPEHCACLEDSVTAPDFRGRGIAPAAWKGLARQLRDDGFSMMVTKVALSNVASRRAVTKAGFVEFAIMRHRRLWPRRRVEVWPQAGVAGIDLAGALPARVAAPPAPAA